MGAGQSGCSGCDRREPKPKRAPRRSTVKHNIEISLPGGPPERQQQPQRRKKRGSPRRESRPSQLKQPQQRQQPQVHKPVRQEREDAAAAPRRGSKQRQKPALPAAALSGPPRKLRRGSDSPAGSVNGSLTSERGGATTGLSRLGRLPSFAEPNIPAFMKPTRGFLAKMGVESVEQLQHQQHSAHKYYEASQAAPFLSPDAGGGGEASERSGRTKSFSRRTKIEDQPKFDLRAGVFDDGAGGDESSEEENADDW